MKHIFPAFIFFLLIAAASAQTGTIKIAKPQKKDTVVAKKPNLVIGIYGCSNYTFKKNDRLGFDLGIKLIPARSSLLMGSGSVFHNIGIEYSWEEQYVQLSAYDPVTNQALESASKTQCHTEYLKIPFELGENLSIGRRTSLLVCTFIKPEYLLKAGDQYHRLGYSDFRQYNLAGGFSVHTHIFRHYRIGLTYAKDFFKNLKDERIYDANGMITGHQHSRTNLLSFSLGYHF